MGRAMVAGPRALFPPLELDDFGWLEPQLRISTGSSQLERSVALFADDTVNRDDGFLEPVVRFARWDRASDLNNKVAWPSIDVRFGHIRNWQRVDDMARSLPAAISAAHFAAFGISRVRDVPELNWAKPQSEFEVELLNGLQRIVVASPSLEGDPLTTAVAEAWSVLESEFREFSADGWRERYSYDLSTVAPLQPWDRIVAGRAV